jgi:hypothetical protein
MTEEEEEEPHWKKMLRNPNEYSKAELGWAKIQKEKEEEKRKKEEEEAKKPKWEELKVNPLYEILHIEDADYRKNCPIRKKGKKRIGYGGIEDASGYVKCNLKDEEKNQKVWSKHRIMMFQWGPPQPKGKDVVNHKNHIRTDNRLCNLEWTTLADNSADKIYTTKKPGPQPKTKPLPPPKILILEVIQIWEVPLLTLCHEKEEDIKICSEVCYI